MTLGTGKTLSGRLNEAAARPTGFDYMRLTLAVLIICFHSVALSYGSDATIWRSPLGAPISMIVPMFFSLSGFLVAGSLERCQTLISFLGLRVLRIVPALAGEVLLSALLLGPILTTLSLRSYFSTHGFFGYFLNILGDIHYALPGVFQNNPFPTMVNGQLWTVPYELICYLIIAAISICGLMRRRVLFLLAVIALHVLMSLYLISYSVQTVEGDTGLLPMNFLIGVLFYFYREHIPWNGGLFLAALVSSLVLRSTLFGQPFSMVFVTYVTTYLGLTNPRRSRVLLGGDYSYGLYLYGWPVQQAVASIGPATHHWHLNILIALPSVCLMAFVSWWLVEKPSLRLRGRLRELEEACLAVRTRLAKHFGQLGSFRPCHLR
jgi:peptidoglycan/LPS O-acetylase OafA/YrhL